MIKEDDCPWRDASGDEIDLETILGQIKEHTLDTGKVYVGADSQLSGDTCTFATVMCLHGGFKKTSRYFFKKEKVLSESNRVLRQRINQEVIRALSAFSLIIEAVPSVDIEIHVDIGSTDRSKTRAFVDSITGWVRGLGVTCKIKPDAWASASVADRHTK